MIQQHIFCFDFGPTFHSPLVPPCCLQVSTGHSISSVLIIQAPVVLIGYCVSLFSPFAHDDENHTGSTCFELGMNKMADNDEMEVLDEIQEENDNSGCDEGMEEEKPPEVFIPGKTQHEEGELESDPSAYVFLHQLQAGGCINRFNTAMSKSLNVRMITMVFCC